MTEAEARRLLADAKAAGRRDAAVAELRALYLCTKDPALWAVARDAFTGPELEGMSPPDATTLGFEKEPALPRRPYGDVLPGACKAPFASGSSVFVLIVAGPLMLGSLVMLRLSPGVGLVFTALVYGYLLAFLFDILRRAAEGHAQGPRLLNLLWSDDSRLAFVGHFANWLGAGFAAFWPLLLALGFYRGSPSILWGAATAVAALLGTAWHPVALVQAAFGTGFSAFHYPRAWERIRLLGADYWKCAAFFGATTAVAIAVQGGADAWAGEHEGRQAPARLVVSWAQFATWMMQMRAAGLLAWAASAKLRSSEGDAL